jgi:hypothetical protein
LRTAFRIVASLASLSVIVQVGFAGYGAFNAIDKADSDKQITKKTIENGFDPHGIVGTIVGIVIVLLVIAAVVAKVEPLMRRLALVLLVLGILQFVFAYLGTVSAPLGFLHGVNALAIYGAAAFLGHRAWTRPVVEAAPV